MERYGGGKAMIEKLYFVYDAFAPQDTAGHRRVVEVTHYPLLDLKVLSALGYSHLSVVAGPMPLAWAAHRANKLKTQLKTQLGTQLKTQLRTQLKTQLRRQLGRQFRPQAPGKSLFTRFLGSFLPDLCRQRDASRFDIATIHDCRNVVLPTEEDLNTLAETLRGRILFQHEIRKALLERGHHITGDLHDILQTLILRDVIGRVPSVAVERFGIPSCRRCGNPSVVQASCASCSSQTCFYCPECASMGQARACRPLYYSPGERGRIPDESLTQNAYFSDEFSHPDKPGFSNESCNQDAPGSSNVSTAYTIVSLGTSLDETSVDLAMARSTLPVIQPGGNRNFAVSLPFELTPAQKHASQLVIEFLQDPEHNECLVFAVCGAGKTEVVFEAIAHVLRRGGKVLFAIPRSDVVAELVPRIGAAIPDARILELRSGAKSRYLDADIVVATTHQALRFFRAFDLVILDEVDAFPYRGSAILHYAVRRATARRGNTVFMTATPDRELLRKADMSEITLVRISARHHGRPLPEPEIIQTRLPLPDETSRRSPFPGAFDRDTSRGVFGRNASQGAFDRNARRGVFDRNTSASGASDERSKTRRGDAETCRSAGNGLRLPDKVLAIVERSLRAGRKVFVFVPTVALSRMVCTGLSASLQVSAQSGQSPGSQNATPVESYSPAGSSSPAGNFSPAGSASQLKTPRIASIHAAHPNRDLHREAFRTGALDIIVSTSVLERGITVQDADVLVLYADYERIFDTATLTQMAGRAGRTEDDTQARVYFVAQHITASMRSAVRLIQDMNRHAARSGYLKP